MRSLPALEVERSFNEVIDAAERGEETIVLRRGKPVAAIVPVAAAGSRPLPKPRRSGGLLSLVGTFNDWVTMEQDLAEIVSSRQLAKDRPPPDLG